jgi:hypothetical protein
MSDEFKIERTYTKEILPFQNEDNTTNNIKSSSSSSSNNKSATQMQTIYKL